MTRAGASGRDLAIRPFRPDEADALAALTLAAIRRLGPRAYSPAQTAAWAAKSPDARRFRDCAAKGDTILVCTDEQDRPLAHALMERSGHVDLLYCHPDHAGRGMAGALLERLERQARASGIARLTTHASALARPVFARAGYVELHRRDFALEHEGASVAIHNHAMEKRLA